VSGAAQANARQRGFIWCAACILLGTLAQLALKWAVRHLPPLSLAGVQSILAQPDALALSLLFFGLFSYALSMLCWFFVLRRLPLSYAYPMLSLSYALVYLLAAVLPWFAEPVTTLKTAGVILILLGIRLIHTDRKSN